MEFERERYNITEAARRLGVSNITLRRKVAAGEIGCYRPSGPKGKIYFTAEQLRTFVEKRTYRAKEV